MEQKANASNKVYVGVTVCMDTQGNMLPKIIHWKDRRSFDIERIGKIDRHYSHNQGGRQDNTV